MNKNTFLSALERELGALAPEERRDAMQYYEEYFEEAGPENEEQAASALGSPKEIAAELLAASGRTASPKKGRAGTIVGICFLIFATVLLGCIALALLLSAVCVLVLAFYLLSVFPSGTLILFGAGVMMLGLGGIALAGALKTGGQSCKLCRRIRSKGGLSQ